MRYCNVLLIRHGESEANASGRLACQKWDPSLTEKGHSQAEEVARALADLPIDHLVTSPLLRAKQTMAPLAKQFGITPTILADLSEVNLGDWDGELLKELQDGQTPEFVNWLKDPQMFPPPQGERILDVGQRVMTALNNYIDEHTPHFMAATTHADCIKGAVLNILEGSGPVSRRLAIPNCGQILLRRFSSARWSISFPPLRF